MRNYKENYELKYFGLNRKNLKIVKRLFLEDVTETSFKNIYLLLDKNNISKNKMYSYSNKIKDLDKLKL